ncbi:hypothetical protein JX266_000096 [Neoarthrinium moseri]|nr:hypothetical protein JX266_000096 [Neoarthrinium moseri]
MLQDLIDQVFITGSRLVSPAPTAAMTDQKDPATCPVDHNSREAWLEQARAASSAAQKQQQQPSRTDLPPSHPPVTAGDSQEACPVDHKARDVWMQQARAAGASASSSKPTPPQPQPAATTSSWTSSLLSYLPFGSSSTSTRPSDPSTTSQTHYSLDTSRVVSTIPRTTLPSGGAGGPGGSSHEPPRPANQELETGADHASGNWVYPSQKMFFEAMKRKGHDPQAADMATVVPIHNAVNERAWADIKEWEAPYIKGTSCDAPRLSSFAGLSTNMSPKARINTWLGYQSPFDRHDWVIDRCGTEIEYIIDFYAGRPTGDGKPSFYLDVRPKLNSWEGVKMRALRGLGVA